MRIEIRIWICSHILQQPACIIIASSLQLKSKLPLSFNYKSNFFWSIHGELFCERSLLVIQLISTQKTKILDPLTKELLSSNGRDWNPRYQVFSLPGREDRLVPSMHDFRLLYLGNRDFCGTLVLFCVLGCDHFFFFLFWGGNMFLI
jgi:hypothetical protein